MIKTIIYKCDKCRTVFVTKTSRPSGPSFPAICIKCRIIMRQLDDDFDLEEIIEEEK